jgi:glycosyltransferase involved in cell wall biosynthesis
MSSRMPGGERRDPIVCSVVIPTYNRSGWLAGCVESVRQSGVRGVEIIVVDDGSTDDTREVVRQLGPDVQSCYQPNAREASARNHGFRHSRGRYVVFLDSDDRWLPGGHLALIELLEGHPEIAVGFADALVGNPGTGYHSLAAQFRHDGFRSQASHELAGGFRVLDRQAFFCHMARRIGVSIGAFVIRRSAFEASGGFDETLRYGSDWELWLRLAACYTVVYLDRPIVTYEKHESNLSSLADKEVAAESFVRVMHGVLGKDLPLTHRQRACVRAGLARRLQHWGYFAFIRGGHRRARERFIESMKVGGLRRAALLYWACCWLHPALVGRLRALKQRASRRA